MSREAILSALFTLVSSSASFAMASRRVRLWGDTGVIFPAIFMAERSDVYVQGSEAEPGTITMGVDLYIYTHPGMDSGTVPASILNPLLDAVDTALKPNELTGLLTLGGLVSHCWIDGKIMKDPGDLDGYGIAVIPVKILVAQ